MGNLNTTPEENIEDDITNDPNYLPASPTSVTMEASNFATDAVETYTTAPVVKCSNFVTLEKTAEIENELEFYEKVSLVYLLYNDAEIALQHLLQLQQGANLKVIEEWAKFSFKSRNWQDELIEALCVIQNYKLICKLGFNINEQTQRFLPLNKNTSLFVNLNRKKMYRIFDDLDKNEINEFLSHIKKDFNSKQLHYKDFNDRYIEMYLLYWTTLKYISSTNFSNLSKTFKVLEKYEISDYIKSIGNDSSTPDHTTNNIDNRFIRNPASARFPSNHNYRADQIEVQFERSLPSVSSQLPVSNSIHEEVVLNKDDDLEKYLVNSEYPGVCLIINQESFFTEPDERLKHLLPKINNQLEMRNGTNVDRDRLNETFKSYGFHVIVRNNLIHSDMLHEIKQTVKLVKEHSSLIICILSHGIKGKVYGSNSIPLEVAEIRDLMCTTNVKNLERKPKILILQACQGNECQRVVPAEEEDIEMDSPSATAVPSTADVLIFWATVPGYGAIRDKKRGSWFIQSLCKTIDQRAHEKHFEEICTLVKNEVIDKRWQTPIDTRAMVPIQESTFSKFFYLPKRRLCI